MTGLLNEKEFSRKSFVKGGGAMIVGFSLLGSGLAGKAKAASAPYLVIGSPNSIAGPPNPTRIDSWVTIHADNSASIATGMEEFGQGSMTGLLQIAGEELNMDMSQLEFIRSDSNVTPNTITESASSGIKTGGLMVRSAAAAAYQALLALASTNLGVPVGSLSVTSGVVSGGGRTVTYGELLGGNLFNLTMPTSNNLTPTTANPPAAGPGLAAGASGTKPVNEYTLVGTVVPRVDIPDKVSGVYTYIQNLRIPGMLHGRVVRPRGQGAFGDVLTASVDASSVSHIPNVKVVQVGNFVGVVAPLEYDAIQAAAQLKVTWSKSDNLPGDGDLYGHMLATPTTREYVVTELGDVDAGFTQATTILSTNSYGPYQSHTPIGPSCSVADVTPNGATCYVNTQGVYSTRSSIATVLGIPASQIRVIFYEGSSTFGNSPYNDAAEAAALLSQQVGKPVRVQFMRWDEDGWDMYEPAYIGMIRAGINSSGQIVSWTTDAYWHGWASGSVDRTIEFAQGATGLVQPTLGSSVESRNSGGIYATSLPNSNFRLTNHQLPGLNAGMLKATNMRAPLDLSSLLASEGMIDELAYAANMDPVEFRRLNIGATTIGYQNAVESTADWLSALNTVAQISNWQPKVAASNLQSGTIVTGRGIALGSEHTSHTGAVADIQVNKKTGKIVVTHLYSAMDAGLTINPGLVENQMVGLLTMGTSRALFEQVSFTKSNVTSLDWASYPILRFADHPSVTTVVTQFINQQPTGAGEEAMAPIPAAIANAFFDATGVRIRQMPMTPGRVRATLKAAGTVA